MNDFTFINFFKSGNIFIFIIFSMKKLPIDKASTLKFINDEFGRINKSFGKGFL